jgi:hypothetical protein
MGQRARRPPAARHGRRVTSIRRSQARDARSGWPDDAGLRGIRADDDGGSADLSGSVGTRLKSEPDYTRARAGRNLHFGVREHAMAGALNGLALHGGIVRPFGSTFLQFSDYMRPASGYRR